MARLIFIGAGAVGTYLGGWLSHVGHDVTLVEHWTEQVEKITSDGLAISGPHESFVAHPRMVHLHESEKLAREKPFEVGFVAVKAYDTRWAARFVDTFVSSKGFIVSAQNSWPDPDIAAAVGRERSVGLIMSAIAVEMYVAGKAHRPGEKRQRELGHTVFRAGEHDGSDTERLHWLIDLFDPIDAGKITLNLWGERWAKLALNCMGNPVVGISGLGSAELAADPTCRTLQIQLAKEAAAVGIALGHGVEDFGGHSAQQWADADTPETHAVLDGTIARRSQGANRMSSMGQDVAKGRLSEIRFINGHVLDRAVEIGLDVPATRAIVDAMRAVDAGRLKPVRGNITTVLENAGIPLPSTR
jgi:2-dehydropantoate 2-reductase